MKTLITTLLCSLVLQVSAQTVTVTGIVTDNTNEPLIGANIIVKGTDKGTQSDYYGNYTIEATVDQQLEFSYLGMKPVTMSVTKAGAIHVKMELNPEEMNVIYITGRGVRKDPKFAPIAITTITAKDIENRAQPDILRNIIGKVPGAQITPVTGALGGGTNFTIRSASSITGNNNPLFIVDGVPFNTGTNNVTGFAGGVITSSRSLDLDPNNIETIQVLRGLSATILYGQDGRNGVVLITTKTGSFKDTCLAPDLPYSERYLEEQETARISLANERTAVEQGYESPYQSVIKAVNNSNSRFETYLEVQGKNKTDATFYIDVYNRFKKIEPEFANRILDSYTEVNSDDPRLLKVLAYKLEEQGRYDLAVKVYRKIMKLQPNNALSMRNLALALYELDQNTEATVLLSTARGTTKSESLNQIMKAEALIEMSENDLTMTKDMRIMIDWNRNDTDLDLRVIDPNLEMCTPENPKTRDGGMLISSSNGFGPEVYELENIKTGSYYLKVGYASNEETPIKAIGPTFVKLTVFRNYGKPNQTKEIRLIKISEDENLQLMDRIAVL